MSTPPSSPPRPDQPDYYRTAFKTLADRNNLQFQCVEQYHESQRAWWAAYHLLNADGSIANYLGSSSGTTKPVAKEHAAKHALGSLACLIASWSPMDSTEPDAEPAMEFPMADEFLDWHRMSTQTAPSNPPTPDQPYYYRTAFKTLADRNNVRFQCVEEYYESKQVMYAKYRLVNQDGSDGNYLGSSSGTTKNIAKEHAAKQAWVTLTGLITYWQQLGR